MLNHSAGFTLIEIVMVIVIIGILAAVVIPRFVDLKSDAYKASDWGFAGALVRSTITFMVGVIPATAVAGTHYLAVNTSSTATGISCAVMAARVRRTHLRRLKRRDAPNASPLICSFCRDNKYGSSIEIQRLA